MASVSCPCLSSPLRCPSLLSSPLLTSTFLLRTIAPHLRRNLFHKRVGHSEALRGPSVRTRRGHSSPHPSPRLVHHCLSSHQLGQLRGKAEEGESRVGLTGERQNHLQTGLCVLRRDRRMVG